jgi:hypothetical protein
MGMVNAQSPFRFVRLAEDLGMVGRVLGMVNAQGLFRFVRLAENFSNGWESLGIASTGREFLGLLPEQ